MRGQRNQIKIGDRFGRLVVTRVWTEKVGSHKSKETRCECLCDCGNVVVTQGRYLRAKHKQSCNCWWKDTTAKDHHGWRGHGDISATVWGGIERESRRSRQIPFEITIEQAWELFLKQDGRCALSGEKIGFPEKSIKYGGTRTASLDRINSAVGYTADNVQWVHKEVNLMKMDLPEARFIEWCKRISHHAKETMDTTRTQVRCEVASTDAAPTNG